MEYTRQTTVPRLAGRLGMVSHGGNGNAGVLVPFVNVRCQFKAMLGCEDVQTESQSAAGLVRM